MTLTIRANQLAVFSEYCFSQFIEQASLVLQRHYPEFRALDKAERTLFVRKSCEVAEQLGIESSADLVSFASLTFLYGAPADWPLTSEVRAVLENPAVAGTTKINTVLNALMPHGRAGGPSEIITAIPLC